MSTVLDNFGYTIRRVTLLGKLFQMETEVVSAQSSASNAVTMTANDYRIVENHPLIPVYGRFRNDPTWDRFMQSIEEYSQEIDAIERSAE